MRVLLLEDNTVEALALQRELGVRHDMRVAASLADAVATLSHPGWRPDIIVTDLHVPDSEGARTLEALQAVAGEVPVVVCTGTPTEVLRGQLDALGSADLSERSHGLSLLKAVLQQHQLFQQTVAAHRTELKAEIDRVAHDVVDNAVSLAVEGLIDRLGLEDEEGLRMAIRLARGWEAAKLKFFSAIATGLGSALLLAVGAGLVAVLRQSSSK